MSDFESRRAYLVRAAPHGYRNGRHCPCCVRSHKAQRTRQGRRRLADELRKEEES